MAHGISHVLRELARALRSGGRLAVVDWSAGGEGAAGPPLAKRFDIREAAERLHGTGFPVTHAAERPETFALVAKAD